MLSRRNFHSAVWSLRTKTTTPPRLLSYCQSPLFQVTRPQTRDLCGLPRPLFLHRQYSSNSLSPDIQPPNHLSPAELDIFHKLKRELRPVKLEVQDISGGCGSMYGIDIVSPQFQGLTVIKQHQLVNKILAHEIKAWHGMQLKTKAS